LAGLVGKAHATLFSKRYGVLLIIGLGIPFRRNPPRWMSKSLPYPN